MTEGWPDEHRVLLMFLVVRYLACLQLCAPVELTGGTPLAG
jgi:hypothetical protein